MKAVILADGVNAAAVAAQTGLLNRTTPFLSGRDVVGRVLFGPGTTGSPVVKIQGADDLAFTQNVTDHMVSNGTLADKAGVFKLMAYTRANVTTAGTAGLVTVLFENGA